MQRQRNTQVWTVFIVLLIAFLSLSAIGMAQEGTWARKADMKIPRGGLSTAVVDGKIYAIGGITRVGGLPQTLLTVEVYDPATNKWTERAAMPTKRFSLSTAVVNGKIYAIGGRTFNLYFSSVEVYDPKADKWTKKFDMPGATHMPGKRSDLSASVVNGKIYVIGGGRVAGDAGLARVDAYDPATDTWTQKTDIPTARVAVSIAVVNGKIYAIGGGGVFEGWQLFATVEAYDPGALNVSNLSASVVNGKIYAIGGTGGVQPVYAYDSATDTWTQKAGAPTGRWASSTSVVNGRIYAIGGAPVPGGGGVARVDAYDPATDIWTKKTDIPSVRVKLSTSVVDGKIYAIGGLAGAAGFLGGQALGMVEAYDPGALNVNVAGKLATLWGKLKVQD
jgi:N-acetylneuraminic acid mutarotase